MEHPIRRPRRGRRLELRMGRKLPALLVILGAAALFIIVNENMRPTLSELAEARVTALAVTAMNGAIMDCMESCEDYSMLVTAEENGQRVYMLQADARRMNVLASDCCAAAQERIAAMGEQGVTVPLGTLTGITFLSGKGPGINVSFTPAGSVTSVFSSQLTSSGINQSLYRVNIVLSARIRLIMPGVSRSITVSAEAAVAENIIVGDVPEVYTDVASEDMLDVIPVEPIS